jgi:HAD superfamily hydrolase (TIGR01509 family)
VIKAIIFDFFGVLASKDETSFRKKYLASDAQKNAAAQQLNDQLGRGDLGYNNYISALAALGGVERETVLQFTENYYPNSELLDYIRDTLKPSYKIGIISNAGQDWVLKILGEDYLKLFDDIVLSYKVGLIKPESEIYELSAKNLEVKAEECVFVDDILRYCQGAENTGMNTVWYQDFPDFKKDLKAILSPSPDN